MASASITGFADAALDALPDATAVLDSSGTIVAVNHAWRMFSVDNGGRPEATGVGVNYLQLCSRSEETGCADAAAVRDGIESVLAGHSVHRELEYPCPSPAAGRWFLLRVNPLPPPARGAVVSHVNITRRKHAEQELAHAAAHDTLTALANRALFEDRLSRALTVREGRSGTVDVGVLFLDLDGFKLVNDTYGHQAGDEVLLLTASRLREQTRPQDTVARLGGDEFAVLAPRITAAGIDGLAARITDALREPHIIHGDRVIVAGSVGIHLAVPGEAVKHALQCADEAMYRIKRERTPESSRRSHAESGDGAPALKYAGSQVQLQLLFRISEALSDAANLTEVSDAITRLVRAHLGAAFTGIAVLDPLAAGHLRFVSMNPLPAETARDWGEIAIDASTPVGAAVAEARTTFFSSRSAADRAFPGIGEHMRVAGSQSIAHLPLTIGGSPIGVLAVSWADEHVIDPGEGALLATVAGYTAQAVFRTRASVVAPNPEPPATALTPNVLQATDPAVPAQSDSEPAKAVGAARPLRVLLVDDTADIRQLLIALFARRSDVEVVAEAGDGQEAIELAAALQPDIIVLDVAMPVLDGISALPNLVAAAPHARIVMLSALPADQRAPLALAAGAAAYVEKTTAVRTLVDELLEGAKLLDVAIRCLSEQVDQQFGGDPGQVRFARHFVTDALARWEQSELAETVALLLSELVTNAIVHARTAPRVSVRLLPDRVHVEVTDQGAQAAHLLPPDPDRASGRGLVIVEALAMGWGTAPLPDGKVVWFDVARTRV